MRKSLRFIVSTLIFMIMCFTIRAPAALAAENPSTAISATVTLSGTLPAAPEVFLIKLSADELSNPMPEGSLNGVSTMSITGAGTVTFPKITFARVGIYKYTIWQVPGQDPDGNYDSSIYYLTVFVTNADAGGLEISSALYKNEETEKSPGIIFNNSYANPARIQLRALKTLDDVIPRDDRFTFVLTDASGQVLQTKQNKSGEVLFDEILMGQAGTRVFFIKETVGGEINIIYDASTYKITVSVSKNIIGDYESAISIEKAGIPFTETPIFRNKFRTGELPYTGEAQSALPFIGGALLLGGAALTLKRKKQADR